MSEQLDLRRTPMRRTAVESRTYIMQGIVRDGKPTVLLAIDDGVAAIRLTVTPEEACALAEMLVAVAFDAADQVA